MKLIFLLLLLTIAASQQCSTCPSQCGPDAKCLGCDSGFFLDNTGACGRFTPIEDCKTYDIQTGKCSQCYQGHLLQYGICQQMIQNCKQTITNNTDVCSKCNDTYVLVDDIHCFTTKTDNCPMGSLPRKLPNGQAFCQKFERQKCSIPSEDVSYCKVCQANYFNLNGVCFNLQNQTACPSNNCNCQFYYKDNVCYQFKLQGCLQSKDKLYCDLCNDTLLTVNGRCFEPVKISDINCNVLQLNRDVCLGCNFQYTLDPNYICVKTFPLCSDPSRTCQAQCSHPNLLFYDGNCYIKDPLCIAYDNVNNKCTKCFEGSILNSAFKCQRKQKCWIYSSDGKTCQKCFTGFQLNTITLNCDKLPQNCRQANNAGVCQNCSSFTQLITQNIPASQVYPANLSIAINVSICVYTTPNCQYYNIFGFCEICKTSFVQKGHQCVPVATNCQVPSDNDKSKCQICNSGYQLDTVSLSCFPKIEGCLQYSSTKSCLKCSDTYTLRNGLCFFKDPNCIQYNSKGNCLRCGNSLIPFYGRCVFYDPYCLDYDSNGFCIKSFAGFSQNTAFSSSMQTNYKSFVAQVRNIQQSSSSTASSLGSGVFTEMTKFGGYFTPQGWIRVLPSVGLYNERISQYDVNGRIRACRDGYTLVNGQCVSKTNNCAEYSSYNGLCARCSPSYHMGIGRKCVPSSSSICLIATSTGESCSKCASSYTLVNGQCYWSGLNVIEYSSSDPTKISLVENGYFIWSKYQIAWPYDRNCVNQVQPGKCLQCTRQSNFIQSGMRNVNGRCILVKQNCGKYNSRGICDSCTTGYFLYYGQCFPNNCLTFSPTGDNCLTCPSLLTYQAGLCVNKIQANCLVYDQIINFNATTTRSISCRSCASGFYLKLDNTCQKMIANCQVTDSQSGRCTQCISGFIIYEETCIREIIGCQIYNRSTGYLNCTQCIANYNLLNNQCFTLPPRCQELNSMGACSKCQTGYVPIMQGTESICIFSIQNCILYNRQGRCTGCAKNYILQSNTCNFFLSGCQQLGNGVCNKCLEGYYLRNGYCILDPRCIAVQNGVCTQCIDGFRLVNGLCVKNTIDNCLTQREDDCLQCVNGYGKIVLYGRVYCILKRIIYSGCSVEQYPCTKCQVGFELRDDGFCYAQKCLYQLTRFSLRTCTACYPYYKLDPTKNFCVLYNCNSPVCYESKETPEGFRKSNATGFLIQIDYCSFLQDDYSCGECTNYRYPNLLVQWNLCYPNNCKSNQMCNCSGNCYNYFGNNVVSDKSVCVADNCQIIKKDGTCQLCFKPYNVVNGICLNQGPCVEYNPSTSQCRVCRDGYNLISGSCIPKNCTSYSPTDVSACLQCQRGYQLTANKTCELKFCQYPGQNYPCTQCLTGFYFNSATNLCVMINCISYDYSLNKCQQCEPQYKLVNDTCILQQCTAFNYNTWKCSQCITGYKLNANGLCVLDNCCAFNGAICSQCCSGYDYVQGLCRSRCEKLTPQNICITCRPGYKLNSNNQCVTQIQGCASYNGNVCVQCQVGLMLVDGRCIPKYCQNYTEANPTFCIQCHPRFYQLNSGLCYPKNCINFNSADWTCQQCQSTATYRFNLIQNESLCFTQKCSAYQIADYVCRQCESNNNNVYKLQIINGSQTCVLECEPYYELVNSQCKLKYCSNYYSNGKCLTCASGYELQASTGYCKLKYCLNYNQQNCVTCSNGFVLDPVNKKYCVPKDCENYNVGSENCQKCQQGFVQEYNLCVLRNCYVYNSQYVCQKCLQGFSLSQVNGVLMCVKTFNSTCAQGYYFSQSRGFCQPIPVQYCSYVNPANPSTCLSCFPNYFLYQGICYSISGCQSGMFSYIYGCKQCIKGFKLQGNLCVKDICDQYEGNSNVCKTCSTGYFLINGTCVSFTNFCVSGNIYQGCVTCQAGYQVVNGICRKLPDNCAFINLSLDCIQCASGYFLYNGVCYKTIANCLAQRASFCDRCDTLYVISNDQRSCISKQPIRYCQQHDSTFDFCLICEDGFRITTEKKCLAEHCSKYNLQTYLCQQCANETINGVNYYYTLRNQRCYSISISFCAVPLNQTACKVCQNGYFLENGVCKASNCQVFKNNQQQCSTCMNGFYLTTNGICQKYPDNCQVVSQNGVCTVCLSGFTLNSNGICVRGTQFCSQYNGDGICVVCQQGYYLTGARVCTKLPDNCLNANILGQCLKCVDPFVLSGSGVCYRLIANCSRYNDLGSCISCVNGFYLTNFGTCMVLPDNCLSASSTGVCRQCVSGFRLENSLCIRQIPFCGIYQNGQCIACSANYYLISGLCYKLPNFCTIVNQQSQCLQCQSSYTLFKGFCYLAVQYCVAYSPLGDCSQCSDGYYVNSAGRCTPIPDNCNRVNLNGICLECASGFVLSNGICYREVSNCFAYDQTTNMCRQCIGGYFLIDGKCYRLPQNCLVINNQQICTNCTSGYTLQNSICYLTLPFCQAYVSNGVCSRCANGYYLAVNGTCTTLPEGCSQIAGTQGCSSCITGYVLQGGICYKEYPNCFLYNQSTRQCRQCINNYFLMNGFCYQLPSNCLSIDSQRQCTSCDAGYILQAGICYRIIANCLAYSGNNCIQCNSGFYVNFGSCVVIPTNCVDVAQNGTCLKCVDGYFPQNGICYKFDKNCIAYNATTFVCRACVDGFYLNYQFICQAIPVNCVNVNIYGNCTSCKSNFTLINGLCYPSIPQCDNWNLTTMLCAKCINGFFLRDGNCYRTVDNCAIYSPVNFNCIKCIDNYILTNNLCITCSDGYYVDNYGQCRPNPMYCKVSNQYGQCLQCQPSFTFINGLCTQEILYCQNYAQDNLGRNICTQCYVGYYMKDQFTCLRLPNGCAIANSTGFCLQCFQGYAVNANGICYTLIPYCQSYQLATGLCLECITNYYLNINQTCTPMLQNNCLFANSMGQCIQCVQGFVLVSSTCYPAIPYCFNHSTSSYTCLQCVQGYYLFNRTCFKIPNGCNNVVNNMCTSCQQGYQLSNGLCQLIDDATCIKYQLGSNLCLQCKAGFYLSANNICTRVPEYCAQANNQGQCLNCIQGYVLSNGICYKEIPNCARWGAGNCIQCIDQFYLQNGLCYKYPDYCQTFDTLTLSCLKCITGYQLSFGRCVINISNNCLYYNPLSTSQCYTCKNTFYEYWVNPSTGEINSGLMTVDNFCKPYPQFCTNVDLLGNCISCCFGSRLENGKCLGTSMRSLNCDLFDSVNLKCLKCMTGYVYCDWLAICIQINLNCLTYNSLQQCVQCAEGFQLLNGDCVKPAPGVSSTNSAICNSGYTYSTLTEYGNAAGSCFRNKNELRKISMIGQYSATYTRPGQGLSLTPLASGGIYNPPSYINNYLSISTSKPQIIHYIQLQGTSNGYVTHYLIQYRNKESSPFICWNSCQKVRGNVNGNEVAELKLTHPIVANEIRIYPLRWVGGIWMSVDMLVENQ